MKNKIGIVLGGYLDENDKLMDRIELNRRIVAIQEENITFKEMFTELYKAPCQRTWLEDMYATIDGYLKDEYE